MARIPLRKTWSFSLPVVGWTLLSMLASRWWISDFWSTQPDTVISQLIALGGCWLTGLCGICLSTETCCCSVSRQITQSETRIRMQRDLAADLNASLDLEEVLQKCLRTCLDVSQLDCGSLHLVTTDGSLEMAVHEGLPESLVSGTDSFCTRLAALAADDAGQPGIHAV